MEDVSDANALFRVTGSGGVGKNELVARGGSGGALAISRAPVGGSASPAPAPLPQPAPSPAPAALPPPALPPPVFRADTPHRSNGAHIPTLEGHAATQIPANPVGAAGPDTPERPASNNKLQPGARAAADSPTPAPPAPPAPSPLFPSHTAYRPHTATTLPDYRHTNHETRTEPTEPPAAPLDLHHHAPRPTLLSPTTTPVALPSLPNRAPHSQPHPVMPGHDVRNPPATTQNIPTVPTSFPNRSDGVPQNITSQSIGATVPCSLPSQTGPGRPISPVAPTCRSYPTPTIGSSQTNSSINSGAHNQPIPYQNQPSIQKHSVQSMYMNRPQHLGPFSVANHMSLNQIHTSLANHSSASYLNHTMSHSTINHSNPLPTSNMNTLVTSAPNNVSLPLCLPATTTSTVSSYTTSQKHVPLSVPSHPHHLVPPVSIHPSINLIDASPTSNSSSLVSTPVSSGTQHALPLPLIDSRQTAISSNEIPSRPEIPTISSNHSTNGYPSPAVYSSSTYPPLYAPYVSTLQHSPYLPPAAASPRNSTDTRTSLSASPLIAPKTPKGVRPHTPGSTGAAGAPGIQLSHTHSYSPRGHSPNRERESFSSSISSLSRSTSASASMPGTSLSAPLVPSLAAPLAPPLTNPLAPPLGSLATSLGVPLSAPLAVPLMTPLAAPTPTPAAPAVTHLTHSLAPVPTVPSISSSAKPPAHWGVTRPTERTTGFAPAAPLFGGPLGPPNTNPFAESLFQSSPGADLLRRELDSRFLAAAGAVRTEMHHHQHQHTHVHQHPAPPHPHPPPTATHTHHPHQMITPHAPLFKDMGKMTSLYRSGIGLGYPYSSSLLHPSSPYVPPAPLTAYPPKPVVSAASESATKPPLRPVGPKTGKWNAMHVRIAWEIYNHQQKEKTGGSASNPSIAEKEKLRTFPAPAPPPPTYRSPYELPPSPYLSHHPHIGVSPFARYGAGAFPSAPSSFGLSAYGRDLALSSLHGVHHAPPLSVHDPWRGRIPPPAPIVSESRREQEERERARREREERERRERDERERRKAREHRERELERVRTRSPLRNGAPELLKEERKEPSRPPPTLPTYAPPPSAAWDPYRNFDPLQHMRFAPFVEAAIRAEEDRAKMFNAYAHHHQLKSSPLLHRSLPPLGAHGHPHAPLPPLGAHPHAHPHASLAPLAPLAPPLAPLAPLDLLKKEEPR